ncbi:sugar isomerase domain-containing protein [Providencia manganoxydans]|uniref:sugar isomerase domain-containing protein n=1 Tax=Providencia manganoxydans TaxID=2923283 RepID=UPI0034DD3FC0
MSDNQKKYYESVINTLERVYLTQQNTIAKAAEIFAQCVRQKGVIYGFGSGHSFAAAVELAGRAGGLVNTRAIEQFYGHMGWLDSVAGTGDVFANLIDIRSNDCFVMVSNSGTKPLHIELAKNIKDKGNDLIVISSGISSVEPVDANLAGINGVADVVIDNHSPKGDCTINIDNGKIMTGPVSSMTNAYIVNSIVIKCIDILLLDGIEPPVMRSINQPGGKEYNQRLLTEYRERIFTI